MFQKRRQRAVDAAAGLKHAKATGKVRTKHRTGPFFRSLVVRFVSTGESTLSRSYRRAFSDENASFSEKCDSVSRRGILRQASQPYGVCLRSTRCFRV